MYFSFIILFRLHLWFVTVREILMKFYPCDEALPTMILDTSQRSISTLRLTGASETYKAYYCLVLKVIAVSSLGEELQQYIVKVPKSLVNIISSARVFDCNLFYMFDIMRNKMSKVGDSLRVSCYILIQLPMAAVIHLPTGNKASMMLSWFNRWVIIS